MCGDVFRKELFLSGKMIFLAEVKMHKALMNSLNTSIYGPANCSGLSGLYMNFNFSVNAEAVKEKRQSILLKLIFIS